MSPRTGHALRLLATALGALGAAGLAGCRGDRTDNPPRQFFPDMDDQPRFKPQSETEFFVDQRTMRAPPAHTVPFGTTATIADEPWAAGALVDRESFLRASYEVYYGADELDEPVAEIPIPVTLDLVQRGRERFNIYCSVCHGYNAEGGSTPGQQFPEGRGGMVGRRWSIPVPTFHDPKYYPGGDRGRDGYLFTVARNGVVTAGVQTMPGYGHALDAHDAWAVVAYIRALQQSHLGELADVPQAERSQLGEPPPPPAPAAPAAPTTEGQQ